MRISRGALLVLIAMSVPIIVELRTVASFVGIEIPLSMTLVLSLLVVVALVFWATLPPKQEPESTG